MHVGGGDIGQLGADGLGDLVQDLPSIGAVESLRGLLADDGVTTRQRQADQSLGRVVGDRHRRPVLLGQEGALERLLKAARDPTRNPHGLNRGRQLTVVLRNRAIAFVFHAAMIRSSHDACHTVILTDRQEDEAALVAEAVAGSERAFQSLVERYQRPVFSLVMRMVRDRGLAEDVTQEVFVKAWLALARYDPRRRFASWLFKIASNAAIDHLRRKKVPTVPIESRDPEAWSVLDRIEDERAEAADTLVKRRELAEALEVAVADLRPSYRLVVLLRFKEELPYRDIAEITGMPLGTVKTNLRRARREIEQRLRAEGVV